MFTLKRSLLSGLLAAVGVMSSLSASAQIVETITVSSIGHTFLSLQPGEPFYVRDYLVTDDPSKGGGGVTTPLTLDLDTMTSIAIKIQAAPGKQFLVNTPAGEDARLF